MRPGRPPFIVPLLLIGTGVALLLRNFLLVENFDLLQYWPALLVVAGLELLLRGVIGITWQGRTFVSARRSAQRASLEAASGELDTKIRALRPEGRLMVGQY